MAVSDKEAGGLGGTDSGEEETDEVGGDFEGDDPPGVGDLDFGVLGGDWIGEDVVDLLLRELDFHGIDGINGNDGNDGMVLGINVLCVVLRAEQQCKSTTVGLRSTNFREKKFQFSVKHLLPYG